MLNYKVPRTKIIEYNSIKEIDMRHGIGLTTHMKVKVSTLIERVRENRKHHEETYDKAVGVYLQKVRKRLEARLKRLDEIGESPGELDSIGGGLGLAPPKSYLDSYDDILAVLEMTTEKELELDSQQLANIIRDKWDWERDFNMSTRLYANEAG